MTVSIKRILYIILGALAGLTSWGAQELILANYSQSYLGLNLLFGITTGMVFGFMFGGLDGIAIGEKKKALLSGLVGLAMGALGGAVSFLLAGVLMVAVSNGLNAGFTSTTTTILPLSRIVAWTIIGLVLGAAEGLRSRSLRRVLVGGLGGMVGGLVGGSALEGCLAWLSWASLARILGFVLLGLSLGFFLGWFEVRFAYGRLRVLTGALKNREYLLSRKTTTLGSSWTCDVWLRGSPEVAQLHAGLVRRHLETTLVNYSKESPPLLNDDALHETKELKYEDVIQVGSAKLLYLPL